MLKFRSPTAEPMHIGLTSGHTTVISTEGNEIPAIFHREAIARGAIIVTGQADGAGAVVQTTAGGTTPVDTANRSLLIKQALQAMLDGGEEGDFTAEGKPNLTKLKARLGFAVTREEVEAGWQIVSAGD
ncbi:hypothetical protein [Comamonas koreensis]|uniref:hypothetical protein n=1 Tax=Comamonas koreensis TaxID=160825 RepID=UPI0015FB269B|nr:hypothetical protein [Comamonas koreensis]